jgi:hypothetical protein
MLAILCPFGFPARFADAGVAQTRYARTMRDFFPVSTELLGHIMRPGEPAETMSRLIMEGQLRSLPWDSNKVPGFMKASDPRTAQQASVSANGAAFGN